MTSATPLIQCHEIDLGKEYESSEKFVKLTEQLHTDIQANVEVNGFLANDFSVNNGVKQGCVYLISPCLETKNKKFTENIPRLGHRSIQL